MTDQAINTQQSQTLHNIHFERIYQDQIFSGMSLNSYDFQHYKKYFCFCVWQISLKSETIFITCSAQSFTTSNSVTKVRILRLSVFRSQTFTGICNQSVWLAFSFITWKSNQEYMPITECKKVISSTDWIGNMVLPSANSLGLGVSHSYRGNIDRENSETSRWKLKTQLTLL